MPSGVYIRTEEAKIRMSEAGKNRYHKPHSEETKKKISDAHKGKHHSEESKQKNREKHLGKGAWNKGKPLSEKTKRKLSETHKGKHHSEETKRKIGDANKGENNANWNNGSSFELYSPAWTLELKQAIRQRDKYICWVCGEYPAFDCHHIDYNKKNCEPENLITLCKSCHTKTNRNRDYWIKYFEGTL